MTTPSGYKRLSDMTEEELRALISRVIVGEIGVGTIGTMTEAQLRLLIRSIVLEELVKAVGGESYVGNLHGFELGQAVELNAKGQRLVPRDKEMQGIVVAGLKADNDEGYLTVERADKSQVLVPWDCLKEVDTKSSKRKGK